MESQENQTVDSTRPTSKERLEKWSRWVSIVYTPKVTAKEFLYRWRRAFGEVQAACSQVNIQLPAMVEYSQFVHAVNSHPVIKFLSSVNDYPEMIEWIPKGDLETVSSETMSRVYEEFLRITTLVADPEQLFVFIARSPVGDRRQTKERLKDSLELTKVAYENNYGPIESPYDIEFFTFKHSSHKPFQPAGDVLPYFKEIRSKVEPYYDGRLILVINGWDGLTTDYASFLTLFSEWAERVTLRVYSEESGTEPGGFFQVNVSQVCDVFAGKIEFDYDEPGQRDSLLDDSTALFLRKFWQLYMAADNYNAATA